MRGRPGYRLSGELWVAAGWVVISPELQVGSCTPCQTPCSTDGFVSGFYVLEAFPLSY